MDCAGGVAEYITLYKINTLLPFNKMSLKVFFITYYDIKVLKYVAN